MSPQMKIRKLRKTQKTRWDANPTLFLSLIQDL